MVVGYQMAVVKGLLVAGINFIVLAVLIVLLIGSSYLQIKDLGMFLKVQAVLVFLILKALFYFTKTAVKVKIDILYFILAFLIYRFFNVSEITVILIFGLIFDLKKKYY